MSRQRSGFGKSVGARPRHLAAGVVGYLPNPGLLAVGLAILLSAPLGADTVFEPPGDELGEMGSVHPSPGESARYLAKDSTTEGQGPLDSPDEIPTAELPEKRLGFLVMLSQTSYDNFFWAASGEPEIDVTGNTGEARLSLRLAEGRGLGLYTQLGGTSYEEDIPSTTALQIGLQRDGPKHRFDLYGRQDNDRITTATADRAFLADILRIRGRYSYQVTDRWQLDGLAEWRDQDDQERVVPVNQGSEIVKFRVGGRLRHRLLSPGLGIVWAQNSADLETNDWDEQGFYLRLSSAPADGVFLWLQVQETVRDFSISQAMAPNFQREDDRTTWTGGGSVRIYRALSLFVDLYRVEVDSSREGRDLETQSLQLGLSLEFGR